MARIDGHSLSLSVTAPKGTLNRKIWIKREPVTELGQRIISAAVTEFSAKGVKGARVAEITRIAGTSDPAFYRYFPGLKQAALFIMSEYYWSRLNVRLSHYCQVSNDPVKLLEAVLLSLIHSATDNAASPWPSESQVFNIVVAQMRNPALLPESLLDSEYQGFISKLEEIIRVGQQRKLFESDLRPALLAQSLVFMVHGLLMQNRLEYLPAKCELSEISLIAKRMIGFYHRDAIKSLG